LNVHKRTTAIRLLHRSDLFLIGSLPYEKHPSNGPAAGEELVH
jgi:hypothetical protein